MNIKTHQELAQYIDHTLLKPTATEEDFAKLCKEALEFSFFSVCVPPSFVSFAKKQLENSSVQVCSVVGFPLGYSLAETKTEETKQLVDLGATEIDMVLNKTFLKENRSKDLEKDISSVVRAANGNLVKVILETCDLNKEEKILACKVSQEAGAHFVKTSTGFGTGGATEEDVLLLKSSAPQLQVKASGGIKTLEQALRFIELGASRLGTSSGVPILNSFK